MEIPDLVDLIWLFEGEPTREFEDLEWPVGLHSFRLTRGTQAVLFSLDPTAGEAYISLCACGQEHTYLGRLRRLERLSVDRGPSDYEGLRLWLPGDTTEPLALQTKPRIRLAWDVKPVGAW
ncbi:hypothetical protein B0T44_04295 [Nocardia donostiensis]|uniref:Uncharacterized protein n=1 Tax=Nocardia donostiensis TaxID=1538463 RepID=A0A1V2THJ1_9NOCA|nr:hypothetical protein B0T46_10170 [Nocardia donostiensis]OQS22904.1 hypothetical protein B0T44_04295 [Nocardia donostiensis]